MTTINQRSQIHWTTYLAAAYAEGFCDGENATPEQQIEAWAYLIASGVCWGLQGWYGRTAQSLINDGIISDQGQINWEKFDA